MLFRGNYYRWYYSTHFLHEPDISQFIELCSTSFFKCKWNLRLGTRAVLWLISSPDNGCILDDLYCKLISFAGNVPAAIRIASRQSKEKQQCWSQEINTKSIIKESKSQLSCHDLMLHVSSCSSSTALYWSVSLCPTLSVHISISPFYFAPRHILLPVHVLHVCTDSFVFNMICFFRHSFWNHTMQTNRFKVGISISLNSTSHTTSLSVIMFPSISFPSTLSHFTHLFIAAVFCCAC